MGSDHLLEIIFALIYFVGSAVYDYLKKKKAAANFESEEGLSPVSHSEPVATPVEPDPESYSWDMEDFEEEPWMAEESPRASAPSAARAALLATLGDWERVAGSVLPAEQAGRVRVAFSGVLPGFSPDVTWTADDDRVGELYDDALRQLLDRVQGAAGGLSFLMGRTCAEVLTPLLDDLQDDPTTPPWIVLPVGWKLDGNAAMLAQLCGFVPVLIPEGSRDPFSLFGVLQQNALEILLSRGVASSAMATAAGEILNAYLFGRDEVDQDLFMALKRHGGVALVVQGMVAAWVVKSTGPLLDRALAQPPTGLRRSVPRAMVAGLSRLYGGGGTRKEAGDDDLPNEAWDDFCGRIVASLETTRVGYSDRVFGDLASPWGTRQDRVCADLLQWAEDPGRTGALRGVVEARAALVAFLMGMERASTVGEEVRLTRLKMAVQLGVHPKLQAVTPSVDDEPAPSRVGAPKPVDAFLLQIIVGPPRALRPTRAHRFRLPHRRVGSRELQL